VKKAIENEAFSAIKEDGAEVICLGCAGMSGFDKDLQNKLEIPVLDGFICALKILEIFNRYGLTRSKINTYSTPLFKELSHMQSKFHMVYKK
jgi:allantoin racemase